MISDEPYRTSTQYRFFSYASPHELLEQRTKTNEQSRSQLPLGIEYLTISEEIELVDWYVGRLWDLCRHFKVPSHVKVAHPLQFSPNTRQRPQVSFFAFICITLRLQLTQNI